jgi:sirohydrochlorin ferrochelatase
MTAPPLVAVAHGSRDPAAAGATRALLDAVREQRPGLTAHEAYLDHGSPRLSELADAIPGPFVVVPLLLGSAYHSRIDIPSALANANGRATQAEVIGPDPSLLAALERRLSEAGVAPGDPETAVVLAAAGSADETSLEAVRALAAGWHQHGWRAVSAGFASAAEPSVERAVADLRAAGAPRVAVASYLLFPGLFADRLAAAGADVVSAPLTDAPEVVALVLSRYDAAVAATANSGQPQQTAPPLDHL